MLLVNERILEYLGFCYATLGTVRCGKHQVGPCYNFRLNFINVKYLSIVPRKKNIQTKNSAHKYIVIYSLFSVNY